MSAPTPLSDSELSLFLAAHPSWKIEQGQLTRTFEANSFLDGIAFVQAVARVAEAADHHPDIDVRWRKVTLRWVTHDAGHRVTSLDTRLAAESDALFTSGASFSLA